MMRQISSFMALIMICGISLAAQAGDTICRYDGHGGLAPDMGDCPTETNALGSTLYIGTTFGGVRVNAGPWLAKTPIDVFGYCRFIDNLTTNKDSFIPFRTSDEWAASRSSYPQDIMTMVHCARPYTYPNAYGPTSVMIGQGDTGDAQGAQYADQDLPYWRTGQSWPTSGQASHAFNYNCYEEYAVAHCWQEGTCCDEAGNCSTCCKDQGSTCERNWYSWSETWGFSAMALDSDTVTPSWSGNSWRIGGQTRPSQCYTRCTFTGHDCTGCNNVAPTQTPTCTIPAAVSVGAACVLIGGLNNPGQVFVVNAALVILSYQAQIQTAVANGDCATASNVMTELNAYVTSINASCEQFWAYNYQYL